MPSLIAIRGLRKTYQMGDESVHALAGVDLEFQRGEFVAILGPSGSGKSTLMHILGFMDTPTEGSIVFEGEEVARLGADRRAWYRSNCVGFVFQSFNLLPRLTVLENVALPLLYREDSDPEANAAAARVALERVGMSHRLDHRPSQLSGGERQRVAIARAIVGSPAIVFADEPTGNLDVKNVARILELLASLIEEGITVVLVTHDLAVASHARRVISMREGLVQEDRRQ
ncbi:macrolide ABC transporter ATP-binding protein [Verrucomicrobiota bacterium]|nr:macrolide ABC transporter ATP-binding protein [Verrucomicrobiota bacterium]